MSKEADFQKLHSLAGLVQKIAQDCKVCENLTVFAHFFSSPLLPSLLHAPRSSLFPPPVFPAPLLPSFLPRLTEIPAFSDRKTTLSLNFYFFLTVLILRQF